MRIACISVFIALVTFGTLALADDERNDDNYGRNWPPQNECSQTLCNTECALHSDPLKMFVCHATNNARMPYRPKTVDCDSDGNPEDHVLGDSHRQNGCWDVCPGSYGLDCNCVPIDAEGYTCPCDGTPPPPSPSPPPSPPPPPPADPCEGGGFGCVNVPVRDVGWVNLTYGEETAITLTAEQVGMCTADECVVRVCASAPGFDTPGRALLVGFVPFDACAASEPANACSSHEPQASCADNYQAPVSIDSLQAPWVATPTAGPDDVDEVCAEFDVAALAACGVVTHVGTNNQTFTAYAQTVVPADVYSPQCTLPGPCSVVQASTSADITVTLEEEGYVEVVMDQMSPLGLSVSIMSNRITEDNRKCVTVATVAHSMGSEFGVDVTLAPPSWVSASAGETTYVVEALGLCEEHWLSGEEGNGNSLVAWDQTTQNCQMWEVCTVEPVWDEENPEWCDTLTLKFCALANEEARSLAATVRVRLCCDGDSGSSGTSSGAEIERTLAINIELRKGLSCESPMGTPSFALDGECICARLFIVGQEANSSEYSLDLSHALIFQDGNPANNVTIYDAEGIQAIVDHGFVDQSGPPLGGNSQIDTRFFASINDGVTWILRVYFYQRQIDPSASPAPAARMMLSYAEKRLRNNVNTEVQITCQVGLNRYGRKCPRVSVPSGRQSFVDTYDDYNLVAGGVCLSGYRQDTYCAISEEDNWGPYVVFGLFVLGGCGILALLFLCRSALDDSYNPSPRDNYGYPRKQVKQRHGPLTIQKTVTQQTFVHPQAPVAVPPPVQTPAQAALPPAYAAPPAQQLYELVPVSPPVPVLGAPRGMVRRHGN